MATSFKLSTTQPLPLDRQTQRRVDRRILTCKILFFVAGRLGSGDPSRAGVSSYQTQVIQRAAGRAQAVLIKPMLLPQPASILAPEWQKWQTPRPAYAGSAVDVGVSAPAHEELTRMLLMSSPSIPRRSTEPSAQAAAEPPGGRFQADPGKQTSGNHQGIPYPDLLPLWALTHIIRP